jgi:hypothetical protein
MAEKRYFLGYLRVNESRESRELLHFFDRYETTKAAGFPTALSIGL